MKTFLIGFSLLLFLFIVVVGIFVSLVRKCCLQFSEELSQTPPSWPYCIVPCGFLNFCRVTFCKKSSNENNITAPSEWNSRVSADSTLVNFNDYHQFQCEAKDSPPTYEEAMGLQ